jgi:hypothetical protein
MLSTTGMDGDIVAHGGSIRVRRGGTVENWPFQTKARDHTRPLRVLSLQVCIRKPVRSYLQMALLRIATLSITVEW